MKRVLQQQLKEQKSVNISKKSIVTNNYINHREHEVSKVI